MFIISFEIDVVTPKRFPKPRDVSSPTVAEQVEPVSIGTEPLQKIHTPKATPIKQKPTVSKHGNKRVKRSQTVAKVNLQDILHAFHIEKNPIVQYEDIDEGGRKLKKGKTAKNLEFVGDDAGFMFQARKPMTRHAIKVLESNKEAQKVSETVHPPSSIIDLSSLAKEDLVMKQRREKRKSLKSKR